jgi:uncharacterized secreted protein with C-terminal beta-propeller domain
MLFRVDSYKFMNLRQNVIAEGGRYAVPDEGASQRPRFFRPLRTLAIIAGACIFCLQMVNTLHAQSFVNRTKSVQSTTTQEILQYTREENYVRFAFSSKPLSSAPLSISLQGIDAESGRWQSLATVKRPSSKVTRVKIPLGWQKADLRVVAYYPSSKAGRIQIPSALNPAERTVTFSPRRGAQLYSIEARPNAKSAWSRVSTLAATPSTSQHRAQIPSSIAAGSQVRVVAVLGTTTTLPASLVSSLPTAMRDGPSRFGAENTITSAPLLGRDALLTSTPLSSDPAITANMVQESDIWKIRGKNIYFFNRLRGLQVIDTSNPGDPLMTSLEIAASGEEMYLVGGDESAAENALLITGVPWSPSAGESTRIYDISLSGAVPTQLGSVVLPGSYVESRMIGNFLHVITTSWSSDSGIWQPHTVVSSINISNGNSIHDQRTLPLSASQVGATAKYLWISAESGHYSANQNLIVFPISADGLLGEEKQTTVGGRIQDKFKVGDTSDGLAVIVQSWQEWEQVTSVETYKEEENGLSPQGRVELIRGESLYASRFDENRCYIVTFRQTDPLWIVDLSEPATPAIRGHLEVPGWSTYIQPLGDVLIAVGRDGGKVQVSMFDVANPEQPTLAQRIDVGESWSWSEAEWNEKAVKILPESGLILIPVVESTRDSVTQQVCLVDFDVAERTLRKRGAINHDFAPRRAALIENEMIASVSNRQLLLVDATNRDAPAVVTDRLLAFGADRVAIHQDTALMIENAAYAWTSVTSKSILRTASVHQINTIIQEIELPCSSVSAAKVFGNRLVLVEDGSATQYGIFARMSQPINQGSSMSVWSLEDPTLPRLIGRVALPFESGSEVQLLSADEDRIAIASRSNGWWGCWVRPMPVVDLRNSVAASSMVIRPPRMAIGGQTMHIAIAEINSASPNVLGSWSLDGDSYNQISEVFSCGDLLAFSFDQREIMQNQTFRIDGWSTSSVRSWLQILDLANPSAPMPWAPVQIPGQLVSMTDWTRAGATIFTRSGERIAALGFNGENASVVAEADAGFAHVMIGNALYAASADGISKREFSSLNGAWDPATVWILNQASAIHSLYEVKGRLAAVSQNQAWLLEIDSSFVGHDIIGSANFSDADLSGNLWIVPAGEYGPIVLEP